MAPGVQELRPRKRGRPLKYWPIIEALDDDELYSGAKIARLARERDMLPPELDPETAYERVRMTMNRMAHNHEFPRDGDGFVALAGQRPTPGWTGRRWKLATLPEFLEILDRHTLYSPGQIVNMVRRHGYFGPPNPTVSYHRLKLTLERTIKLLAFPPDGDGLIALDGQAPFPGWFGWRWQAAFRSPRRPRFTD